MEAITHFFHTVPKKNKHNDIGSLSADDDNKIDESNSNINHSNVEDSGNPSNSGSNDLKKIIIHKGATHADKFKEGKQSRNHIYCGNFVEINGKIIKCQYHKRPSRYDDNHDCSQFIDEEKQRKIDNFLTEMPIVRVLDTADLSLEDHVALVCAQLNFSIRSICSNEFNDLLLHFIRAGQKSFEFGKTEKPNKIYKVRNRRQIRQRIIDLSKSSLLFQCQLTSLSNPIAAALDGGTVAHNHFVDILFNDIIHQHGTFLFKSYTMSTFTAKDYMEIGKDTIDKALEHNITVSCFVGDRLPAQMKGLDHLNPESMQNKFFDNPKYSAVLFIPCTCHIFNRSLLKITQKSANLSKCVEILCSLQVLLRKPSLYLCLKKFIPSLIETRWVFMFDVAFWAIQNKEVIDRIFKNTNSKPIKKLLNQKRFAEFKEGIPEIIRELTTILMPIKIFIDKIESNRAPLWWVKPLFDQLINHLKTCKLSLLILSNECQLIINAFQNDYKENARIELIETAYSFTSIGRNDYRKNFFKEALCDEENEYPDYPSLDFSKYLKKLNKLESDYILRSFIKEDSSSDDETQNEEEEKNDTLNIDEVIREIEEDEKKRYAKNMITIDNNSIKDKSELKQETLFNYYSVTEQTINEIDEENKSQTNNHEANSNNISNNASKLKHWRNLNEMKNESSYQCSLYCINELCKIKKFDREKKSRVRDQYKNFFQYSAEKLPNGDLIYDSNTEFWAAAVYSNSMNDIAELATTFLSIPATQAICERNISVKRSSVSKQQYKIKNDILTARARLSCLKGKIQTHIDE